MDRTLPAISVVICTFDEKRADQLRQSVTSLDVQTRPPDEVVIVVDHNSRLEDFAREEFRSATVRRNVYEPGLSGARNSGTRHARGEVIAFLDDDAWASPTWLEALLRAFDDPRTIGAGGNAAAAWLGVRPKWFPEEFLWVLGCSYRGLPAGVAPIRNPLGSNMAFRRVAFEKVGGFRSDLGRVGSVPLGAEETEFSIRVQSAFPESRVMYVPEAVVYHAVPPQRATVSYFIRRCYGEGLSKAHLRRLAGSTRALAAERGYLTTTIPSALTRTLACGEMKQASALIAGVAVTGIGFLVGTLRRSRVGRATGGRRS